MWNNLLTLMPNEIIDIIVKGGLIMIPLLASSLIAVTVILERFAFWHSLRKHEVDRRILALAAEGDFKQAMEVAGTSRHPVARVLHAGLRSRDIGPGTAMQAAAQAELRQPAAQSAGARYHHHPGPPPRPLGHHYWDDQRLWHRLRGGTRAAECHYRRHRGGPHRDRHGPAGRHRHPDPVQLLSVQDGSDDRHDGGAGHAPGAPPRQARGLTMRVPAKSNRKRASRSSQ